MISLKGSRFLISCDNYTSKVYTCDNNRYKEVTKELSDEEKDELIDDLIYAISDILKEKQTSKPT